MDFVILVGTGDMWINGDFSLISLYKAFAPLFHHHIWDFIDIPFVEKIVDRMG